MLALLLSTLAVSSAPAAAHVVGRGCGGHALILPRQAAPTDVASQGNITDPVQQCTPYSYPRIAEVQPNYPTIWETARIPASDSAARDLFTRIEADLNSKLPNATPKPATGAPGSGYSPTDPDCWWTWQGCTTPDPALGIPSDLYDIPTPNTISLTIDDGPNCSQNAFYDFLRQERQKVSMYFIGSNVMVWPLQAMRAHEDGHEICVHTWSHQPMTSLTNEQVFAELYYTRQIIKDLMGITSRCWRPPQGDVDNRVRVIAAGLNLTNILWTDDTDDWRAQAPGSTVTVADVDANYQAVIDGARNGTYSRRGSVLLAHQSTNFTMSKLVEWIPRIKAAFTHVVPFASAMNWTTPYAESAETFPTFEQYIAGESAGAPGSQPTSGPSAGPIGGNGAGASASASAGGNSASGGSPSSSRSGTPSGGAAASSSGAAGKLEVAGGMGLGLVGVLMAWATL